MASRFVNETWIELVLDESSLWLVPSGLAPDEDVAAGLDVGIVIQRAERDDRVFGCVESLDEQL